MRRALISGLCLLAVSLLSHPAIAVPNIRLTNDGAASIRPHCALDPSGNVVVVWEDGRYGNDEILWQKFDQLGNPLTAVVRVTNTGITAYISSDGRAGGETNGFQPEVRTWTITRKDGGATFYTLHGDVFVYACALISLGIISASFIRQKPDRKRGQ